MTIGDVAAASYHSVGEAYDQAARFFLALGFRELATERARLACIAYRAELAEYEDPEPRRHPGIHCLECAAYMAAPSSMKPASSLS